MTYFITGGTGFIGNLLIRRLLEDGHQVVALVRPQSRHKTTDSRENLTWKEGDLLDPPSLEKAMQNCDRVFHVAAYASVWAADDQYFYDINVTGTRNVLEAAVNASVERLVYTSTAATLPPSESNTPTDESSEKTHFYNPYEHSKYLAEQKVRNVGKQHGIQTMIVQPTRVFGPGPITESNAATRLIKYYMEGKWRIQVGHGRYIGNYCYVRDLVEGHLLAMEHGTSGEQYLLGGTNLSFQELFSLISEETGIERFLIPLPEFLMRGFARFEEARADIFGGHPLITPEWLHKYLRNWMVSSAKAQRELGYTVTPPREAIRETVQWLRREVL